MHVPGPGPGSPGGRAGARAAAAGEKAAPAWRVPAHPGSPRAGRGGPAVAAQLGAPVGPAPLSLPRACQSGPNLISVLSVRTPLKPNSASLPHSASPPRSPPPRPQGHPGAVRTQAPRARPVRNPPRTRSVPAAPTPGSPGPEPGPGSLPCRTTGSCLRKQWDRGKLESGVTGRSEGFDPRLPRPAGIPWKTRKSVPCLSRSCAQREKLPPSLEEAQPGSSSRPTIPPSAV